MRLRKRERVALITLLLALVGLALDRLLLPPPEPANAAAEHSDPAAGQQDAATTAAPAPEPMAPASPDTVVPDVFAWGRLGMFAGALSQQARPERLRKLWAEEFAQRHQLCATILGPHPVALVDERTLRIGDQLDGFALETIREREAVFVSDEGRVVLRVGTHKEIRQAPPNVNKADDESGR
ncbi:MAG: hypothetical protein KKB50_22205 [Planctomycetes bacterium]|nr:hypothetical protein [Planctomycetota bacterium]